VKVGISVKMIIHLKFSSGDLRNWSIRGSNSPSLSLGFTIKLVLPKQRVPNDEPLFHNTLTGKETLVEITEDIICILGSPQRRLWGTFMGRF